MAAISGKEDASFVMSLLSLPTFWKVLYPLALRNLVAKCGNDSINSALLVINGKNELYQTVVLYYFEILWGGCFSVSLSQE